MPEDTQNDQSSPSTDSTPTHVLYQLEDHSAYYAIEKLILYPDIPVPVSRIRAGFLARLLEEKIVARCDENGNLAPEEIRFAVELPTEESAGSTEEFAAGGVITATVPVIVGEPGPETFHPAIPAADSSTNSTKKKTTPATPVDSTTTVSTSDSSDSTENTKSEG